MSSYEARLAALEAFTHLTMTGNDELDACRIVGEAARLFQRKARVEWAIADLIKRVGEEHTACAAELLKRAYKWRLRKEGQSTATLLALWLLHHIVMDSARQLIPTLRRR